MPAARRIFACMEPNRKIPRSFRRTTAKPAAFELPPDRAFVLQLDACAQPPHRVAGRVEHVTSGQVAHITSLRQLAAFLAAVLQSTPQGGKGGAES
jgi:hypothetical protein